MTNSGQYTDKTLRGWRGKGSKTYVMGNELKNGGEGYIYEIKGNDGYVAKIYSKSKFAGTDAIRRHIPDVRYFLEHKILTMLQFPPRHTTAPNGAICLAWPVDMLYDNGAFVGYIMPRIVKSESLVAWRDYKRQQSLAPGFNYQYYIAIAMNLSATVAQLHAEADWFAQKYGLSDQIRNQVFALGDFNDNNIMVSYDAEKGKQRLLTVALVDMDSINVYNPIEKKMYKCCVAAPGFASPELLGGGVYADSRIIFTHQSDRFDLALHIFQLLMDNVGAFNGMPIRNMGGSSPNQQIDQRIAKGLFPYNSDGSVKLSMKISPDRVDYSMIPSYIRELFARAFTYNEANAITERVINNRPTAAEWSKALTNFYDAGFLGCRKNPSHVYPKIYQGGCPWCDRDKRKNPAPAHTNMTQTIPVQNYTPQKAVQIVSLPKPPQMTSAPNPPTPPSVPTNPQINRSVGPLYAAYISVPILCMLIMNADDPLTGGWFIGVLLACGIGGAALAGVLSKRYIIAEKPGYYYLGLLLSPLVVLLATAAIPILCLVAIIAFFVALATGL